MRAVHMDRTGDCRYGAARFVLKILTAYLLGLIPDNEIPNHADGKGCTGTLTIHTPIYRR